MTAFFAAAESIGIKRTHDYNGFDQFDVPHSPLSGRDPQAAGAVDV
jgi:hypothetical protein